MKSYFSFVPTVLSFLGLYQTNLIEDHGYQMKTVDHLHLIRSPYFYHDRQFVNAIGFTPEAKAATIYIASNDQERMHDNKLTLAEIYNTLCEKEGLEPENMQWITFDVHGDPETDGIITFIHDKREIYPMDEVVILPTDMEWDLISRTEYYQQMQMIASQPPQRILLRNYAYRSELDYAFFTNCIYFSFASSDNTISTTESGWPFDDEDQRAVMFIEEQQKEFFGDSDGFGDSEGSEQDDEPSSPWFSLRDESPLAHPQV